MYIDTEYEIFSRMAKVFPNLTEISGKYIDTDGLRALGRLSGSGLSCITFDYLDTCGKYSLDMAIDGLCKGNPNLKVILFGDDPSDTGPVTDAAVHSIVQYCPHIEKLSLSDWKNITNLSISYLTQLSSLREIDLSCCIRLTSDAVQGLLKANRKLEALKLSDANRYDEGEFPALIDNALLRCIGLNCPNLAKLHLRLDALDDDSDVTAASFEAMIKGLPVLSEFLLYDYDKPNSILPMLRIYCPLLKEVSLDNIACSDADFTTICQGCPLIESLHLSDLHTLTDPSIVAFATHCPHLSKIRLHEVEVTDDSLFILFTSCIHLTSVSLSNLPNITDLSILTLLRCCPRLIDLTLCDNILLTEYCVVAIPVFCPLLESLDVWLMPTLTHETIVQLTRYCKHIKSLYFYHCDKINNNAVIEILHNCKYLTKLNIYSTSIHTTESFISKCDEYIIKRSKGLRLVYTYTIVNSV